MKQFPQSQNNIPNPVGLDFEIGTIQSFLINLDWIEAMFGIAFIQKRTKSEEESTTSFKEGLRGTARYDVFYPQGRSFDSYGVSTDIDLTFDDSYASRVFFLKIEDTNVNPRISNWDWTSGLVEIVQNMALIFHCNLQSIQIDSSEYLKNSLLDTLQRCPKVIGTKLFESMENVWKEFTITPEMNGVTRFPNYCLRIEFTITYLAEKYNER